MELPPIYDKYITLSVPFKLIKGSDTAPSPSILTGVKTKTGDDGNASKVFVRYRTSTAKGYLEKEVSAMDAPLKDAISPILTSDHLLPRHITARFFIENAENEEFCRYLSDAGLDVRLIGERVQRVRKDKLDITYLGDINDGTTTIAGQSATFRKEIKRLYNAVKKAIKKEMLANARIQEQERIKKLLEERESMQHFIRMSGNTSDVVYVCDLRTFLDAFGDSNEKLRKICNRFRSSPGVLSIIAEQHKPHEKVENALMDLSSEYEICDSSYDAEDYFFNIPGVRNSGKRLDPFKNICIEAWPGNIGTVSHLRHWRNIWGDELLCDVAWYKGIPEETLLEIAEYAPGHLSLKDAAANIAQIKEETIKTRTAIEKARRSAKIRQEQLEWSREHFCEKGTRYVKLALNKLVKKGDPVAKALRLALEAEDKSISAKSGHPLYVDKIYAVKQRCIEELLDVCIENGFPCGLQPSDSPSTTHVAYFDIPGTGQVSFHFSPRDKSFPLYEGTWDGEADSTLWKLQESISTLLKSHNAL